MYLMVSYKHQMNKGGKLMEETVFLADPTRLMIAAAVGILVLLVLIIKFKLHPVLSMMVAAIIISFGCYIPVTL